MSSDVCKHCTHAGCLDVCPTGALFRTEFGTVVVQQDICNGCGYCVSGCPYGVIERREGDGRAWKCTLCYDRLKDGLEPACAHGLPDRLDPVRRPRRAARAGRGPGRAAARAGRHRGPALRRGPGRRRRRQRRVLPAARRAGGLRPPARPGGADPRPPSHVDVRRAGRRARCSPRPSAVFGAGRAGRERAHGRRPARRARPRRTTAPRETADGAAGRVRLLLRAADPQAAGLGRRHRLLLLRSAGCPAGSQPARRRAPTSPAGRRCAAAPGSAALAALGAGSYFLIATSAGRSGSSTCCGSPSRPRR